MKHLTLLIFIAATSLVCQEPAPHTATAGSPRIYNITVHVSPLINQQAHQINTMPQPSLTVQPPCNTQLLTAATTLTPAPLACSSLGMGVYALGAFSCAVVVYATVNARIYQLTKRIARHHFWASWHADVPLLALRELPTPDIASALRATICEQYYTSISNNSLLQALIAALHDIELGLKDCAELRSIYRWIKRFHATQLCLKQPISDDQLQEQQERLLLLKEIINHSIVE